MDATVSDSGLLARRTVSDSGLLARRVAGLTAGLVLLIAVAAGALAGPVQAAGALAGGAVTIGNFLWLHWTAARALRPGAEAGSAGRRIAWAAASAARYGVVALALGLSAAQGWLGLPGLLLALLVLPVTVVTEGLRSARTA
jgi:hypothetical protein